jgi:folate-binding protein YgfZ
MIAPADGGSGGDPAAEYRAAHDAAILADRSGRGRLALRGRDAADLMHRLTTNAIKDLEPSGGCAAVFATAKGRIIDLVTFHNLEDHLLCLTGEGRSGVIASWIDRYTFREDVRIEDRTASHEALGIYGARAARVAAALCGEAPETWPLHRARRFEWLGVSGILVRTYPLAGEGFHVIVGAGDQDALRRQLLAGDAPLRPAGTECLEALRIEAGLPAPEHELTEDYNPWEAGLADAVALDKGCYVGQEVIARLNTYRKVSKNLVRLRVAGSVAPTRGSSLELSGRRAGTLTSAAVVPGEGRVIGLGYVQDEHAEVGMELDVATPGDRVRATIEGPAR